VSRGYGELDTRPEPALRVVLDGDVATGRLSPVDDGRFVDAVRLRCVSGRFEYETAAVQGQPNPCRGVAVSGQQGDGAEVRGGLGTLGEALMR